ncbi:unnamed protein product [Scytosiphon promiscuus]
MVVVSLSPPSSAIESLRTIALPGSPMHRCYSCFRHRARARRPRNDRRKNAPPQPPSSPASPPPMPLVKATKEEVHDANEGFDVESMKGPPTMTRPASERRNPRAGRSSVPAVVVEVVFTAGVGSLLDLDHFFAAGSLRLSKATGLAGRPWGHCVMALFVLALATAALTHNARAAVASFVAGSSHQLRDATRRGLWMYPPRGPKTPPLPYAVYLLAQMLLPVFASLCLRSGLGSSCHRYVRGCEQRRRPWLWPCARSRNGYHIIGPRIRKMYEEEDAALSSLPL